MTTYNKQTLATFFQTGDVPSGTDYANLIDSQVNIVETSVQSMGGPLATTELITPRVSAAVINVTGTFSPASISTGAISGTSLSISTKVSAAGLNVTTDVSAGGTVFANSNRASFNYHGTPVIVSAVGTAQASGAILASEFMRLQGATDGSDTGFRLVSNQVGWIQYLSNECAVSANLWPPVGGIINNLSTNIPFPMAAGVPYIVMHRSASAYAVK